MREGTFKIDRAIAKVEAMFDRMEGDVETLEAVLAMLREIRETDPEEVKP